MYQLYPRSWRDKASADWRGIRESLLFLRRHGRLDDDLSTPTRRHVRGLIDIYLAESDSRLDPNDDRVVRTLRHARDQFTANENDDWAITWIPFQEADMALRRGAPHEATALVDELVGDWGDLDDRELLANLHRIHADAAWQQGDAGLALDCHARAVLHAYHFQLKDGLDEYTAMFMTEMRERAVERLVEVLAAGETEKVRDACRRARKLFGRYWWFTKAPAPPDIVRLLDEGRPLEAIGHLFPPTPSAADLHRKRTAYEGAADDFFDRMEDVLAEPPGTPLPPA